jgi:hypothetical protein
MFGKATAWRDDNMSAKDIEDLLKKSGFRTPFDNVGRAYRAMDIILKGMASNKCKFCGQAMNSNSVFYDKCGKAQT